MTSAINFPRLAQLVRSKRGTATFEDIASECGLSVSTLWRVEQAEKFDMSTSRLLKLCDWLGVEVTEIIRDSDTEDESIIDLPAFVTYELQRDPNLTPQQVRMVSDAFAALYHAARQEG